MTPRIDDMFSVTKRQREWLWFFGLWITGLMTAMGAGAVIKFLMSLI